MFNLSTCITNLGVPTVRYNSDSTANPNIEFLNSLDSSSTINGSVNFVGGVGIQKKLYVGDSIYLPTSGGTASGLNFYEEYLHSTNFSGIWASPQAGTIKITRIGRQITLFIPELYVIANTSATIAMATILPARFRPSDNCSNSVRVTDNNVSLFGTIKVYMDGNIAISAGASLSAVFSGVGSSGLNGSSIVYSI